MNFANYSPYNKSYKFICLQNQAYHQKNKRKAAPCVRTNLHYPMNASHNNPQFYPERRASNSQRISRSSFYEASQLQNQMSSSMMRSSSYSNPVIKKDPRVIHKHLSFEKFRSKKVNHQNTKMVNRLLQAQCQVVKKQHAEKSFNNHMKYRDIRKRYNDFGSRKTKMHLGNSELLCPTLAEYHQKGLAEKFVQYGLSMSMAPVSPLLKTRKMRSSFDQRSKSKNQP